MELLHAFMISHEPLFLKAQHFWHKLFLCASLVLKKSIFS